MLQILTFTEAKLSTLTPRSEMHGDDAKPAISLGIEIVTGNVILDLIDPGLRPALYKYADTQPLPGVDDVLNVLRCNSVDRVLLETKHEGWTLAIEDGIDETDPLMFGGCKVDKLSVEPKQGGSIVLRLRVGTSDLDAARAGMLGMHIGQSIWITLTAPKPGGEKMEEDGDERREADATDLFVAGATEPERGEGWPFPGQAPDDAPPAHLTERKTSKKERTALGTP